MPRNDQSPSLKGKALAAGSWSTLHEVGQRSVQLGISIVIARLLTPAEFGLIAMLTIFIELSRALIASGFGSALIQRKDPTDADTSSVFFFNLGISVLLAGLLCLAAPWIAAFYEQPQLIAITRVMSLQLIINGLMVVQNALLTRRLDFKRLTIIGISSTGLSGAVGLFMAWRGFGVWSLVGQQLSASIIHAAMFWAMSPWRPKAIISLRSLRNLLGFGFNLAASSVLDTIFRNAYLIVIGKLFSPAALGLYTRAHTLEMTPSRSITSIVGRVIFPLLARLQDEPARLQAAFRKAIKTVACIQFPVMLGLAAVAEPLVLFLLTDKWAGCIPYLQLLCFVGMWYPMHAVNLQSLLAVGRSDAFFRLEILKKVLTTANILITFRYGIVAMICGQIVNSIIALGLHMYYTQKHVGYPLARQVRDFVPYLTAAIVMAVAVAFITPPWIHGVGLQLLVKVAFGAVLYAAMYHFFNFTALDDLLDMARRKFLKCVPPDGCAMKRP